MVDVSAHTADIPLSLLGKLCPSRRAEELVLDRAMSNRTHSLRMSLISYTYGLFSINVFFFLLILQTTKDNDH